MSKEIYLNPQEFQEQIDTYKSGNEIIKALKYDVDPGGLFMQCIDRYLQCLHEFNEAIKAFGELSDLDLQSMNLIKSEWLSRDRLI